MATEDGSEPLRVLIVRGAHDPLADWQAMLVDRLERDPMIELVGATEGQGTQRPPGRSLLMRGILAVERLIVRRQMLPYDTRHARSVLEKLSCISAPDADLAIELGARRLPDDQLAAIRQGAWSVTFAGADDATSVATTAAQRKAPGMAVQIRRRTATNPEPALIRSAQYNQKPGAVLTGAFVEEKSVLLVLRALRDAASDHLQPDTPIRHRIAPASPGAVEMIGYLGYFAKSLAKKLREKWRAQRGRVAEYWNLATGTGDITELKPRDAGTLAVLRHTMADPFLFENEGKTWVFYEAMNADDSAGWIEVAELDGDALGPGATALACPYHLSFPFVFRDGADIYMMPETQQTRRLEIWRATDFPTAWERYATAFEGMYLADSSLWQAESGQWWLLTNLSDHHAFQDHSSELYLFAVDGPRLGSVTPHPGNPVAIGADIARNAGALIRQNGRLFRPSQNNSHGVYGYGLNLMEVTRLDATAFEETLVQRWTPEDRPGIRGIHHLSASGNRYVFDWSGA